MCELHELEWLDSLITVSLNPKNTDLLTFSDADIYAIIFEVSKQKEKVIVNFKSKIFALKREKQIALVVNQSHSELIMLLELVLTYQKSHKLSRSSFKTLYSTLTSCLEELLSFIEIRFLTYLSLNERVPRTYLFAAVKELRHGANRLKTKLSRQETDTKLVDIVLTNFYDLIRLLKQKYPITFRELLYQKDLLKELELLDPPDDLTRVYTPLEELLVLLNFNSKAFMGYFTRRITERLNSIDNLTDRLERLLFYLKQFNQLYMKPGEILNPQYGDLKTELGNWFTHEAFYLEKRLHLPDILVKLSDQKESKNTSKKNDLHKLLCILSVDQMALLLRAADDLKIVTARSLNSVFKTIVPYLSTPNQESISYDSMRSKSYNAERRDKEIVIQALQQIIKKINEY